MTDTITQVSLPSGNYLFVKVPKDAIKFDLRYDTISSVICMRQIKKTDDDSIICEIKLVNGFPTIIGLASTLNDEQWGKIVEVMFHPFSTKVYGYIDYSPGSLTPFKTKKESGHSLVKSKGMEISECLILKID